MFLSRYDAFCSSHGTICLRIVMACACAYIYIYGSVLVNEMPKSARYHIDRANSIVFTSKRLPGCQKGCLKKAVACFIREESSGGCSGNLFEVKHYTIYIHRYHHVSRQVLSFTDEA